VTPSKMKFTALLLVAGAVMANAGPVAYDTCATICDIAQTKFQYVPGQTYIYDYEGETITKVEGATEELSGLNVKTTAKIRVITPCEAELTLTGTELSHLAPADATKKTPSPVGGAFKAALEAQPLRFGATNGKVLSDLNICGVGAAEPAWVLNIKRGIISALQNSMADLNRETTVREADVLGTCETSYKIVDGAIVKTKNLLGCTDREHMKTAIQHAHYMAPSDVQGLPLLRSTQSCKQTIKDGIIGAVECVESHVARPFSNGDAGAATTLKLTMTFKKKVASATNAGPITFRAPLFFDLTKTEKELKDAAKIIKAALAEICTADGVEDKSPERFAKLIKNVQALDKTTLAQIHRAIRATGLCRLAEKTFHDVLPLAGTTPAVSLMKDILLSGEINGIEKDMWKAAIAFIPHPNAKMIAEITPLLAKPDRKIYLSASTLVRNFCTNNKDCGTVKEVQDFVKVLESRIGNNCGGNDVDVVLMSLKAVGNAGVVLAGRDALIKCAKNDKIPLEIRLAALEAFRHMKLETAKPELIAIYKDMEQDSELRIGAFVALMRDPCSMCVAAVEETMAKEKMLQVGSFVMSYMNNVLRAANPMKAGIKEILKTFDETKITKDWNLERMKYSRAYEASYFAPVLNAGVDAESHVIFSQSGFLPRQIKTDLKVNLFGRSIDLLEVGARIEGLETLLEYYFGPEGALAETAVGRAKRAAIKTEKVDAIHQKFNAETILKEPHGHMYFKMFGSELGYADFDLATLMAKREGINTLELLRAIAKNHETEYTHNFQLMDLTYTIPTVVGLPLKLDLNAHGSFHLKVGGKLDLVKFMKPPRSMDIDGHIKPSAAIEVRTEMGIDAFLTRTGIKMVANMHTSTAVEGKVMLKDGKVFKVHYAVPKQELEIFHGMTKFYVKHHDSEREQRMITKDAITLNGCTGEKLATLTGLEMCGELRLPNASMVPNAPYFPLTGPINARIVVNKRDLKLMSYDFEASRTSVDGIETAKLIFDTPGSTINREISMIFTVNTRAPSVDFHLKSPWKKFSAAAALVNNADLKRANIKFVVDETKEYSAVATVQIQKQANVIKYIPGLEIRLHQRAPATLKGFVTIEKGKKIAADLALENLAATPITLALTVEKVGTGRDLRFNHNFAFTSPLMTLKNNGFSEKKALKFTTRTETSFKFREGAEHKMVFSAKIHSEKKQAIRIFNVQSTLGLSDFPEHNMGLDIDFKKTAIDTKFDVEARFRRDIQPVKFSSKLVTKVNRPLRVGVTAELTIPSRKMVIHHELIEKPARTFTSKSVVSWAAGEEAKAEFTVIDATIAGEILNAQIEGFVVAPCIPKIDIVVKPMIKKTELKTFVSLTYGAHKHVLEFNTARKNSGITLLGRVTIDGVVYETNVKLTKTPNILVLHTDLTLNGKPFEFNLNGAIQKTALKVHSDVKIIDKKYEININGEMTGQAIKAHADVIIMEKKMEANMDYFRNGINVKVLMNAVGLDLLKFKISSVALKVHNEFAAGDLTTLVELKADKKTLILMAIKGTKTATEFTANAKINALTATIAADTALTFKDNTYTALANLVLPTRSMGLEAKFAGNKAIGQANIVVNWNKEQPGEAIAYGLKWSTAAPRDRVQFAGEINMNLPMWIFPAPIKMTALLSKDIRGIYMADLVIDYSLKFQLKAIHKLLPTGIQTNIDIATPIEDYEKMSAELVATVVDKALTFKLAALKNKDGIEVKLIGKADITPKTANIEGDFTLKSPFKHFEVITAAFRHKHDSIKAIASSAELKWGINKKVAVIFDHMIAPKGDVVGKLIVITPAHQGNTVLLEYELKKAATVTVMVKCTIIGQTVLLTTSYTPKPGMDIGFLSDTVLKLPGKPDIALIVDMAYRHVRNLALTVEGKLGARAHALVIKADRSAKKIEALVAVKTPENPEGYSVQVIYNDPNHGKNLDATLLITYFTFIDEPKKTIKLVAYLKKDDWSRTEGKIEFITPFTKPVTADFGWHISTADGIYKANFALEHNGKRVTFEEDLLVKLPALTYSCKVTTPLPMFKLVRLAFRSTGALNNLISHTEIQVSDFIITTDVVAKLISLNDFEGSITVKTPIKGYENTVIALGNKGKINNLSTKASLVVAGRTWTMDSLLQFVNPTDLTFKLVLKTPLRNLENIVIDFLHKGTLTNMVTKVSLSAPKLTKPVVVELAVKFVKAMDMEAKLTLLNLVDYFVALPDGSFPENVALSFINRGETLRPLITILSATVGPRTYALTSTLNFRHLTDMDGSIILTTPIPKFERVGITFNNKIKNGNAEATLDIEFQTDRKITATGFVKKTGNRFQATVTILTPYAQFDKAVFSVDHDGTLMDFTCAYKIEMPKIRNMEMHLMSKLNLNNGITYDGSVRVDTIFFSTTQIATHFEMKGTQMKLTLDGGYGLRKVVYALTVEKKMTQQEITYVAESTLKTDYNEVKSAATKIELVHARASMQFKLSHTLDFNGKQLLALAFEHIPTPTGCKCIASVAQEFLLLLPRTIEATLETDLTKSKSAITIVALVDRKPTLTIKLAHTLVDRALTGKLIIDLNLPKIVLNAETNVLLEMPLSALVIGFDASLNNAKIADIALEYRLAEGSQHTLKLKAIVEGKTLMDTMIVVKANLKDAAVTVHNEGVNLAAINGGLNGETLETHITWKGEPLIDAVISYKKNPLVLNLEAKWRGEVQVTIETKLDLTRKAIDAKVNIDPIINSLIYHFTGQEPTGESWVITIKGRVKQEARATTGLELEVRKADKMVKLTIDIRKAGKLDLTLRPARLAVNFALTTNIVKDGAINLLVEINKNTGAARISIVTKLNNEELSQTRVEYKNVGTMHTGKIELALLPTKVLNIGNLNVGSIVTIKLNELKEYEIQLISDLSKAATNSVTISVAFKITPAEKILNLKTIIPSRTMELKASHIVRAGELENLVDFSWEAGKSTGYTVLLKDRSKENEVNYILDAALIHPIRTMKVNAKLESSIKKHAFELNILPDIKLPNRKTAFTLVIDNESYGAMINYKVRSTFSHPVLEKPLALAAVITLNRGKMLFATNLDLDYSKFPRKRITTSFRIVNDSRDKKNLKYSVVAELKQPANFIDVRLTTTVAKTDKIVQLKTLVSYMTSARVAKTVEIEMLTNLEDKSVVMHLITPDADRKIKANLVEKVSAEGRFVKLVVLHEDVKASRVLVLADIELNEASRALRIELGGGLKIETNIHDKYMLHFTVIRSGKTDFALKTSFKDKTHMLINTRINWNPALVEDIKTTVPALAARVGDHLASAWTGLIKELVADLKLKVEAIGEVNNRDLKPIFEAWRKFVRALEKDLDVAIKGLRQMYRKNEFHLKDVGMTVNGIWDKLVKTVELIQAKLQAEIGKLADQLVIVKEKLAVASQLLQEKVKLGLAELEARVAVVKAKLDEKIAELKPIIEKLVKENLVKAEAMIKACIAEYEPKFRELVTLVKKVWTEIQTKVIVPLEKRVLELNALLDAKLAPLKIKLDELITKIKAKLAEIKANGLTDTLIEIKDRLQAQYADTAAAIVAYLEHFNTIIEAKLKELEEYPYVKELKRQTDELKAKLIWAWKYMDLPGELKKLVADATARQATVWRILKDNRSGVLNFDTAAGILDFDVEIPIALKNLASLPTFDALISRLETIKKDLISAVPKIEWTLLDYYYYYMPAGQSLLNLIPPFKALGIVAGNQHYYTFDGKFYEFAGDCSYVLARDFVDGNFTVIVNYRKTRVGPRRNSITVVTGGKTIEIFNTFKTVVDKTNVELPVEFAGTSILRAGPEQVVISNAKGITVTCHMTHEVCTVAMDGWYFGKTGGLLGTYDYEPETDITNPSGKRVNDIETFAKKWEVAKICRDSTNHARLFHQLSKIKDTPAYQTCAALFESDASPLRPAFRVVDPVPFMTMCINDVYEFTSHANAGPIMNFKACTAVHAYMAKCRARGINVPAPDFCMTCTKPSGSPMLPGETLKIVAPVQGTDTVVLFEENPCNKNKRKDLLGVISNIEKALRDKGMKENRYGLAAFGGHGVHAKPHFHTIEGQLMNTDRKFVRGVRSLEFGDKNHVADVEEALEFVTANYPWRTGATRNVILVQCSDCSQNTLKYNKLRELLSLHSVHLHILRDFTFQFRNGKKADHVLGFDHTGVFITKDTTSADLTGDAALLAQLAVPKDICVPLAQDTQGSFFTLNSWTTGRIREQKKFLDIFSRRLMTTSLPLKCQICECRVACPFTMKTFTVCKPCTTA